jgi:hypothetical protein
MNLPVFAAEYLVKARLRHRVFSPHRVIPAQVGMTRQDGLAIADLRHRLKFFGALPMLCVMKKRCRAATPAVFYRRGDQS